VPAGHFLGRRRALGGGLSLPDAPRLTAAPGGRPRVGGPAGTASNRTRTQRRCLQMRCLKTNCLKTKCPGPRRQHRRRKRPPHPDPVRRPVPTVPPAGSPRQTALPEIRCRHVVTSGNRTRHPQRVAARGRSGPTRDQRRGADTDGDPRGRRRVQPGQDSANRHPRPTSPGWWPGNTSPRADDDPLGGLIRPVPPRGGANVTLSAATAAASIFLATTTSPRFRISTRPTGTRPAERKSGRRRI